MDVAATNGRRRSFDPAAREFYSVTNEGLQVCGIARRANSWPLFYQMTIIDSPREGTPRITISK